MTIFWSDRKSSWCSNHEDTLAKQFVKQNIYYITEIERNQWHGEYYKDMMTSLNTYRNQEIPRTERQKIVDRFWHNQQMENNEISSALNGERHLWEKVMTQKQNALAIMRLMTMHNKGFNIGSKEGKNTFTQSRNSYITFTFPSIRTVAA